MPEDEFDVTSMDDSEEEPALPKVKLPRRDRREQRDDGSVPVQEDPGMSGDIEGKHDTPKKPSDDVINAEQDEADGIIEIVDDTENKGKIHESDKRPQGAE